MAAATTTAALTAREFKLLMKPELFPTKKSVLEFNKRLVKLANNAGVDYQMFDRVDSEMRTVQFFDTPDCVFRNNHIILRLRRDMSSGWPDETFEVTFKRRTPNFDDASNFDVSTTMEGMETSGKFKEEIIRGDLSGSMKSIYSHNLIGFYPVQRFDQPMSRIMEIFPGLKALKLDPSQSVSSVNGARVFEIGARLGVLNFGKNTSAHVDLAVWTRPKTDSFNVLVAEFGWSYHVKGDNEKQGKANENADAFFKSLQKPFNQDLFDGSTKTALIYGVTEN